jgi:histidinol-phosphatase
MTGPDPSGDPAHDSETLAFALELSRVAEAEILPRFRKASVERKADGTVVTEADREAERVMRERIARRFPADAVLGEEWGALGPDGARRRWILDPIDGTIWFTLGVPVFGTLIGLVEEGRPRLGVVHFPALGETLYAEAGRGCWWRLRPAPAVRVRVAGPERLESARVSACGPHGSDVQPSAGRAVNLTRLIQRCGAFRFVGDCLQHALVCQGRLHAAIDTLMKPWDIAALVPCVREAGGVASTLEGDEESVVFGDSLVTSCHAGLHGEVLKTLAEAPPPG